MGSGDEALPAPGLTRSPEILQQEVNARQDRIKAIQDGLSSDARDILIRFGRQKAFSGGGKIGGSFGALGGRDGFGGGL